ncbi:MAG TPA: CRTAC1 family protein, partial [Chitinophagaceae bacterium]|nr:CRTAC1 family protein [Chitinophagaceae bacterium]
MMVIENFEMMKFSRQFLLLLLPVLLYSVSCVRETEKKPGKILFTKAKNSGIDFTNTVQGNQDFNVFTYRNFYNGAGVATGDINNDGLTDVFFVSNEGANKLYLNKGNFRFDDISEKAGFGAKEQWSTGIVLADINHDGWLDIYLSNAGNMKDALKRRNQLFINNQNLTFTEQAHDYGLDDSGYTTQASFFDYDMDGDLDCFMVNNSPIPVNTLNNANNRDLPAEKWPIPDFLKGGGDHLYRNDNGHFNEVTKEAGIHGSLIGLGLGVTVGDVNGDDYPDVYVSNDFFERDYLYINQRNGTFKDEAEEWLQHTSLSSMGADMADINNDGYPDIFTTDMLPSDEYRLKTTSSFDNIDQFNLKVTQGFYYQFQQNTLQLNNGNGKFLDIARYSGVDASDWSWGGLFFDADNDGNEDIYVCNGIQRDVTDQDFIEFFANELYQKMVLTGKKEEVDAIISKMPSNPIPNKAFRNNGNLRFTDAGSEWGFTDPSFSNGASYADLDNDGDLDLVVNNVNAPSFVYRNNSREISQNHYIAVFLKGDTLNTFAIGSKIKLYANGKFFCREIIPSRGFESSADYKQIIGLGNTSSIDSMLIVWPDKTISAIKNPAADTLHLIKKPAASNEKKDTDSKINVSALLQQVSTNFDKHKEDDYNDFYFERNLPEILSREGPKAAIADVDGDGLQD